MTIIRLIKKDNNIRVNTLIFNISTNVTGSTNNNLGYNDVQYFGQEGNIITDIPVAIQTIASYLERELHNRNIIYINTNTDSINRVMGNVNSHSYISGNIRQEFVKKDNNDNKYIELQRGGKRLVRYGKRAGKYYIKGGRKNYIK